ncbi:MAG: polyphosphate kinase 2 family protein [Chitinivibrionales bacterium]|nr:polyphosphate kinase 2 family protein [Chitinivibrionales bacterium]
MIDEQEIEKFLVEPGSVVELQRFQTRAGPAQDKEYAGKAVAELRDRMAALTETLYVDGRYSLLVVIQAMDAAGKDSTIRRCFGSLNPMRCTTAQFRSPTVQEKSHDFLWRIHQHTPPRGTLGIFNRSHYEDVLVARVKGLAPREIINGRYDHINAFEKMLYDEGTRFVKLYLHVSKDYQRERLLRRIERPDKRWKFSMSDLEERKLWDYYIASYEQAMSRCSTEPAPWYIIPSEQRWFRDLVICSVVVRLLESLDLHHPSIDIDPNKIEVD